MVVVEAGNLKLARASPHAFGVARAMICSGVKNGRVTLYLPDYGVKGVAELGRLRRTDYIMAEPIVTFLRMQVIMIYN